LIEVSIRFVALVSKQQLVINDVTASINPLSDAYGLNGDDAE